MIRELACALLLFAGVVRASSVVCNLNHRCVYHELCVDGLINTDGSGIIDPRTPKPVPDSVPYPRCEKIGTVCCRHPDNPDGPDVIVDDTCPFHHRCVSTASCINGEINTSGIGLLDIRINQNLDCVNPEYSSSPAVCCRNPGPADSCPATHTCVPRDQCNGAITDPQGTYIECNIGAGLTGVCCRQPLETCPQKFVCLPDALCKGEILDVTGASVPHHQPGSWERCLISGSIPIPGVCCTNPSEETELPPADGCGISHHSLGTRIKNTDLHLSQTGFAEFPWQGIIFDTNLAFKCGGSLIGDQWLLTAAHCIQGSQPKDLLVRLGEWKINSNDEFGQSHDVGVESITVHPGFSSRNFHNNIAVLKLAAPVPYKYHINTICLPESGQVFPAGERCFATGWGKDAFGDTKTQVALKKVDLPLVAHGNCQEHLRKTRLGYEFILDKSFLCAGGEEGKDTCKGDGGGPLSCLDPSTGRYVLVGITAWGIGCGQKDVPGVYADVQYIRDWLKGIVGV
ncbi:inactive CLIP domain-containing serine protease A8-like [Panulirus ornatus]|uniref:inactive CLIP domain-containing serine protease A8-like n=1 Tax=Panulirus ornatus TaxID=150431 RepID=UPI003A88F047